ncbi:helix-turn-helix transcriptional regulator [Psychromicrobium xiongbiense]|uniref:helix-turn-helix transcriptional regulator n=1 Tax=Psychromicrobium xiongbiense TaxID=3051184 RepID=UPI002552A6DE|nr:helix-turn-helix transcriptional regulator [Psychromicrobium sp. YIM S02556]
MVRSPLSAADVERGQRLGSLLRCARAERSLLEVALRARISPETLRKIETGRVATPSFSTVAAIAAVLSLSLDEIWSSISDATAASPTKTDAMQTSRALRLVP